MPVVSKFLGILITMYWNEHNPAGVNYVFMCKWGYI